MKCKKIVLCVLVGSLSGVACGMESEQKPRGEKRRQSAVASESAARVKQEQVQAPEADRESKLLKTFNVECRSINRSLLAGARVSDDRFSSFTDLAAKTIGALFVKHKKEAQLKRTREQQNTSFAGATAWLNANINIEHAEESVATSAPVQNKKLTPIDKRTQK